MEGTLIRTRRKERGSGRPRPGRFLDSLQGGVGRGGTDDAVPVYGVDAGDRLQNRDPVIGDGSGQCAEDRLLN